VGFLRCGRVAVVVPRWPMIRGDGWSATSLELPPGRWGNALTRDLFDGGRVRAQIILERFPVALLVSHPADEDLSVGTPRESN